MIEFLSSWAKSLGLAIVIVSILEMLLPNNKNKKYIRTIMGIYIIFNVISPFISNKDLFDVENFDIEEYVESSSDVETISENVDQTSMDKRIQELYIEELEKDITKKLEENGYKVTDCDVKANITESEDSGIEEIKLKVEKGKEKEENNQDENLENKIVNEIQKIKKIDTSIKDEENLEEKEEKLSKTDIQNIKKILIDEYEVNEKCLKIN